MCACMCKRVCCEKGEYNNNVCVHVQLYVCGRVNLHMDLEHTMCMSHIHTIKTHITFRTRMCHVSRMCVVCRHTIMYANIICPTGCVYKQQSNKLPSTIHRSECDVCTVGDNVQWLTELFMWAHHTAC